MEERVARLEADIAGLKANEENFRQWQLSQNGSALKTEQSVTRLDDKLDKMSYALGSKMETMLRAIFAAIGVAAAGALVKIFIP